MHDADLHHPAVGAVLAAAADLLGMQVVFVGRLDDENFTYVRVHGEWAGIGEGVTLPRNDTFCGRLLNGAPRMTSDAGSDPAYRDLPARELFGITSYVAVPLPGEDGRAIATLGGYDTRRLTVDEPSLRVLERLGGVVAAHLPDGRAQGPVIRRTATGWKVGAEPEEADLTSAMLLADLLASEIEPGPRPSRPEGELDEVERLRLSVLQLEHALAARVTVEQAIGILAERQRLAPRAAFERLRRAARSRGRRVHDLARAVVASASDPGVPLPPELAGRRPMPPAPGQPHPNSS